MELVTEVCAYMLMYISACHVYRKMLLCDTCDAGWHMFCLPAPLSEIPDAEWFCPDCNVDVRSESELERNLHGGGGS